MSDSNVVAYVIVLIVNVGGYEKMSRSLIRNSCEELAIKEGLLGECHCPIGSGAEWLEEGQQVEDLYGEMIYTLYDAKPVTEEEYKVIKKFI